MTENICWFCKTNPAQPEYLIQKKMYDPKSRRCKFRQRAVYDGVIFSMPRCKECAAIHRKVNSFAAIYTVLLIIFTVLATYVGYLIEVKIDMANLSIYIGIGAFVIGLLMIIPFIKVVGSKMNIKGVPQWNTFPGIQERIKEGWLFGTPVE